MAPSKVEKANKKDKRLTTAPSFWAGGLKTGGLTSKNDEDLEKIKNSNHKKNKAVPPRSDAPSSSKAQPSSSNYQVKNNNNYQPHHQKNNSTPLPSTKNLSASRPSPYKADDASSSNSDKSKRMTTYNSFWTKSLFGTPKENPKFVLVSSSQTQASAASASPSSWQSKGKQAAGSAPQSAPLLVQSSQPQVSSASASPSWSSNKPQASSANASSPSWHSKGKQAAGPAPHSAPLVASGSSRAIVPEVMRPGPPQHSASDKGPTTNVSHQTAAPRRNDGPASNAGDGRGRTDRLVPERQGPDARSHPPSPLRQNPAVPQVQTGADRSIRGGDQVGVPPSDRTNNHKSKGSLFNFGRQHTRDADPRIPKDAGVQETVAKTGQDRVAPPRPPRDGTEWNQSRSVTEGNSRRPTTELPSSSGRKETTTSGRTQPLLGNDAVEIRTAEPLRIVKMKDVRESMVSSGTTPDERNRSARIEKGKQPVSLGTTTKTRSDETHQSQQNSRGQLQSSSQHGQSKEVPGRPKGDDLSLGRNRAPNPSEMAAFATQPSNSYAAGEQFPGVGKYVLDPKTGYLNPVPANQPLTSPPPQQTRQEKKDHHDQKSNGFFSAFHIRHHDARDTASRQQGSAKGDINTGNQRVGDRKAEQVPFSRVDEQARPALSASQQHQRPSRSLDETNKFSAGTSKTPALTDSRQNEAARHQRPSRSLDETNKFSAGTSKTPALTDSRQNEAARHQRSTSTTSPSEYRGNDFSDSPRLRGMVSNQTTSDRTMSPHTAQRPDELSHTRSDNAYRSDGSHHRAGSRSERNPLKPESAPSRDLGFKASPSPLTGQSSAADTSSREAIAGSAQPAGASSRRVEILQDRDKGRDRLPVQSSQEQASLPEYLRAGRTQQQPDRDQEIRGKSLHDKPPTRHPQVTTPVTGDRPSRDHVTTTRQVQKQRDHEVKGSGSGAALAYDPSRIIDSRKPSSSLSSDPSHVANEPVAHATEKSSKRPRVEQLLQATEKSPAVQVSMVAEEKDNSVPQTASRRHKEKLDTRGLDGTHGMWGEPLGSSDRTPGVPRPEAESTARSKGKPSFSGEPGPMSKKEARMFESAVQPARDERLDARKPAPLPREEPQSRRDPSSSTTNTPLTGSKPSTQPQPTIVVSDADVDRMNTRSMGKLQSVEAVGKPKDSFSVDGVTFEEVSLSQHRRRGQEKKQEPPSLELKPTEAQQKGPLPADSLSFRERSLRQPSGGELSSSLNPSTRSEDVTVLKDFSSYQPRPSAPYTSEDSRRKDKALQPSSRATKDEARPDLTTPATRAYHHKPSSGHSPMLEVHTNVTMATDEDGWPRTRTTAQAGRGKFVERWSINDEVNVEALEGQKPAASTKPTSDATNTGAKGGLRDWLQWGKKGKHADFPVLQEPEKSAGGEKNLSPDARPQLAGRTESAPVLGQDSAPQRVRPERGQHSLARVPLSSESKKGDEATSSKKSSLDDDKARPLSRSVKDSEESKISPSSTLRKTNEIVAATSSGSGAPGGDAKPSEELSPVPSQQEFLNRMSRNINFRLAQDSDEPSSDLSETTNVKSRRKSRNRNFSVHGSQSGMSVPTVPAIPTEFGSEKRSQWIPSTTDETSTLAESSIENLNVPSEVRKQTHAKVPQSDFSHGERLADTPQRVQFATVNPKDSTAEQHIGIRTPIKLADSLVPGSPAKFEDLPSEMNRKSQMVAPLALASVSVKNDTQYLQPSLVIEPASSTRSARVEHTARPQSFGNRSVMEEEHELSSGLGASLEFTSDRPEDSSLLRRHKTRETSDARHATQLQTAQRPKLPNFDHSSATRKVTLSSQGDNVPTQNPESSADEQSGMRPQLATNDLPTPRLPTEVAELGSQRAGDSSIVSGSTLSADNGKLSSGRRVEPKKNVEPLVGADSTVTFESGSRKIDSSRSLASDHGEVTSITAQEASIPPASDKESHFPPLLRDLERNVAANDDESKSTTRDKMFKLNLPDDFESTFSSAVDQRFTAKSEQDKANNDERGLPEPSKPEPSAELKRPAVTKDKVLGDDSKLTSSSSPAPTLVSSKVSGADDAKHPQEKTSKGFPGPPAMPVPNLHPLLADQPQQTEDIPVMLGFHHAGSPNLYLDSKSLEEPPPPSYQDATHREEHAPLHYTDVKYTPSVMGNEQAGSSRVGSKITSDLLPGSVEDKEQDASSSLNDSMTAEGRAPLSKPRLADEKTTVEGLVSASSNSYKDDHSRARPQIRSSVSESLVSVHDKSEAQLSSSQGPDGDQISSWLSRLERSNPETRIHGGPETGASKRPLDRGLPDYHSTLYSDHDQLSSADQPESVRRSALSTGQRRQSVSSTVPMFVESSGHIVSNKTSDHDLGEHLELSSSPGATQVGAISSKKDIQDHPVISTWLEQVASQPFCDGDNDSQAYTRDSVAISHDQTPSVAGGPAGNNMSLESSGRSLSSFDGTVVSPQPDDTVTHDTIEESEAAQANSGSFKNRLRKMFGKSEHGELSEQSDRAQPALASPSNVHLPKIFEERGMSPQDEPDHDGVSHTGQTDYYGPESQVFSAEHVENHGSRDKTSREEQFLSSDPKEPHSIEDDAKSDLYEMNIPRKTTSPPNQTEIHSEDRSLSDNDSHAAAITSREMSFVPDTEEGGELAASTIIDDYLGSDSRRESLAYEPSRPPATAASEQLQETAAESNTRMNGEMDMTASTPTPGSSRTAQGDAHEVAPSTDEDHESVVSVGTHQMTSDAHTGPVSSSVAGSGEFDDRGAHASVSSPQTDTLASGNRDFGSSVANTSTEPICNDEDAFASLSGTSEPPPAYREDDSSITAAREVKTAVSGGDSTVAPGHDAEEVQEESEAKIVQPGDSHSMDGGIHDEVLDSRTPSSDEEHTPTEQVTSHHGLNDDDLGHSDTETEFEESVCSDYVEEHNQDGGHNGSASDALKADDSDLDKLQDDVQEQDLSYDRELDVKHVQEGTVESREIDSETPAHECAVDEAPSRDIVEHADGDAGTHVIDEHLGVIGDGGSGESPEREEAPVTDATLEEARITEEPIEEAPVEESVVEGGSVQEAPVEAPVVEAPVAEAPVAESSLEEAAASEEFVEEPPVEHDPVPEAPVEEAIVAEAAFEEAPVEEVPAEAPVEESLVEEAPSVEAPIAEAPLEEPPSEDATVEEAPAEEALLGESPRSDDNLEPEGNVTLDNFDQHPASDEQESIVDDQPLAAAEQTRGGEEEVLVTDDNMDGAPETELGGEPKEISQEVEMSPEENQDLVENETGDDFEGDEDALEMNEAFRVEHEDGNDDIEGHCNEGDCGPEEPSENALDEEACGHDDESIDQDGPQEDEDPVREALDDEALDDDVLESEDDEQSRDIDDGHEHEDNEQEGENDGRECEDDEQECEDEQECDLDGAESLHEEDAQGVDVEDAEDDLRDTLNSEDEQREEDETSTVEEDSEFDPEDYEEMPFDDAGFGDESHQQDPNREPEGMAEGMAEGTANAANEVPEVEDREVDLNQLYAADISSLPPSPTGTDFDQGSFGSPSDAGPSTVTHPAEAQGQQSMSIPASSQQPNPQEGNEEETRAPVRFSHLYRQSVDWEQALDPAMLRKLKEAISQDCEESTSVGDSPEPASESAREEASDASQMLLIDQEQVTPVAASPLSPRPLATPPPDWGSLSTHGPGDHHSNLTSSSRAQITPPPDLDLNRDTQNDDMSHSDVNGYEEESLDANQPGSKGPKTFEDMGLLQRPSSLLAPPDNREDHGEGSSSISGVSHGRSLSQRFSGWWSNAGAADQRRSDSPPPPPIPYDSRYGEDGSSWI